MFGSSSSIVKTLSQVPLLSTCTKKQLNELAKNMTRKRFSPNTDLMKEGEEGYEFYIIIRGECIVTIINKENGKLEKIAKLGIGDYCGEQALIKETTRNATVTALNDVIALRINRETFKTLIQEDFGITFATRKAVCGEMLNDFEEEELNISESDKTKSAIERKWIWYTVSGNILFSNLTPSQKGAVIDSMYRKNISADEYLIKEGDKGNHFYVIRQGKFEISKKSEGLIKLACPGDCVGELALLYNAPRAASVKAINDSVVWCLHRGSLRKAIMEEASKSSKKNIAFLKKVPLLGSLLSQEILRLDEAMEEVIFSKGDIIISQGDEGDNFYIIKQGSANVIKEEIDPENKNKIITKHGKLNAGSYFGERALLTNEKRAATIECNSNNMICLTLNRKQFNILLGPLDKLMNRNMEEYKRNLRQKKLNNSKSNNLDKNSIKKNLKFSPLNKLEILGLLGRGGYGLVKLVKDPLNGKTFALKEVRKDKVVETHQTTHIRDERRIMNILDSPFLVNLWYTYKDRYKVYFLLDVCLGGDLFTLLRKNHSFKENVGKFYAACVIQGFEAMHELNICYRDLKPENLVLDNKGYIKITDFGFAKELNNSRTFTLCGTPDYLAPEIIMGRGHDIGVDYWTLGILIYEMLGSMPPFYDREPTNIYRKIIRSSVRFPAYFSNESKDIIKKLLKKKPTERLGITVGGINNIKKHKWFENFNWNSLINQTMKTPFVPKIRSAEDISNFKCQQIKESPPKAIDDDEWANEF